MDFLRDSVKLAALKLGIAFMLVFLSAETVIYERVKHFFMFKLRALIIISCSIFSGIAYGERSVELYKYSQLVLDQSVALRQQAITAGLASMIIKVSGSQDAVNHPLAKDALKQANAYVTQYGYESTDETLTILGDSRPASRLSLQFSGSAIERLLKNAQLPIWPTTRPEVLVWVVSDQQGKQFLDDTSVEVSSIKVSAERRGLPVSIPLLDLTDRQSLSAARIWAMDEQAIEQASSRYDVEGVLAGRVVSSAANAWQGRFVLLHGDQRRYFNGQGVNPQQVAKQIIDKAANYFANLEAIVVNDESNAPVMAITVNNIENFGAYAALLEYLNNLTAIVNAVVTNVNDDQVSLRLAYSGTRERVLSTLAASEVMSLANPVEEEIIDVNPAFDESDDSVSLEESSGLVDSLENTDLTQDNQFFWVE